ncbi:MAG: VOC family protein [Hyphomonadaceae bacterium]|nr:VOC family protein [Hyphomonadaceae bacterium]
MARVLGIGGLFFKSADGVGLRAWYGRVLGLEFGEWGGVVFTPDVAAGHPGAGTVLSPFAADTDYFEPSTKEFMFNLMVDDLDAMLARAKAEGVEPVRLFPDEINGRFAHIIDPEGRKIELWEPKPMPTP